MHQSSRRRRSRECAGAAHCLPSIPIASRLPPVKPCCAFPPFRMEAPTELQRKFFPSENIWKKPGMKVSFVPVSDYAAVVESLATKSWIWSGWGGFTFVQAKSAPMGHRFPIIQREGYKNSPPNSSRLIRQSTRRSEGARPLPSARPRPPLAI